MGPGSPLLPCAGGECCHPQFQVLLNPRQPSILGAPASSCLCFTLKSQSPAGAAQIPWHLCADPTRPCPLNMEPLPNESPRRCLGHSSRPSELSMREGEAPLEGAGRGVGPCYHRGRPGGQPLELLHLALDARPSVLSSPSGPQTRASNSRAWGLSYSGPDLTSAEFHPRLCLFPPWKPHQLFLVIAEACTCARMCVCVFTHLHFHFETHSRLFLTICLITSQSHRHPPLLPMDGPGASPPKQHPGDRCSHLGRLQVSAHWSSSWMGWGLGEGGTDVAMGVWSPRDQLCMRALGTCSGHTGVPAAAPSPLQLLPPQAPSPLQTLPLQLLSHPLSPPPPCSPPSCGFGWVTSS